MDSTRNILFARRLSEHSKQLLEGRKLNWKEHSFMDVEYIFNKKQLETINNNTLPLVFTSKHGVLSIKKEEDESNCKVINRSCYAISPVTQKVALTCGFKLLGHASNSKKLAQVIVEAKEKGVIHSTTIDRRKELYDILKAKDIKISPLVTYKKAIKPKSYQSLDIIVFFSPSQIKAFLESNQRHEEQTVFCIGQTTANFARKQGFNQVIVPEVSSEEQIILSIIQYTNSYE